MKKRYIALSLGTLLLAIAVVALCLIDAGPRSLEDTLEHAFGYKLRDDAQILRRENEHISPLAIQGIVYSETTELKLSGRDFSALANKLKDDPRFTRKEFNGNRFFESFIFGKQLVTYQLNETNSVLWYQYREW